MKQVVKFSELPTKISSCKNYLYYILTHGNLFVLNKNDHSLQQQFYKQNLKNFRPKLLSFAIVMMQAKWALCLMVEGGLI